MLRALKQVRLLLYAHAVDDAGALGSDDQGESAEDAKKATHLLAAANTPG